MPVSARTLRILLGAGLNAQQLVDVAVALDEAPYSKPKRAKSVGRRAEAVMVACPSCGVAPGFACIGKKSIRVAIHIDRYQAAIAERLRR